MVSDELWRSAQVAEREFWESGVWEQVPRERRVSEWKRHLRELGIPWSRFEGEDVLDVGCGPVGIAYFLEAARRVGLDPLADTYERWNGMWGKPIELVQGPAEDMPFPSATFDTVFCINVLDHTREPSRVIEELRRVLKPGGLLVLHADLDSPIRHARKWLVRGDAVFHPQHISYRWLQGELRGLHVRKTHSDPEVFRGSRVRDAAFWDRIIYVVTHSSAFMNHVWIAAIDEEPTRST